MWSAIRSVAVVAPVMLVAGSVACAGAPEASPADPTPASRLLRVVDSVFGTPPLDRAHWGIEIVDLSTGAPILRRNADRLFTVASNQKLITMATALALLGPDYRYVTNLVAHDVADGVARSLVVHGSGDPTLSELFHDGPFAAIDSMADSLSAAGLRRVDGPLVVDQSRFDSALVHPAWQSFDLDWYYAAPVTAFAVARGAIPVRIAPGSRGAPADVELLVPEGLVRLDAAIGTVTGDRGWNDELERVPLADSIRLRGTVGVAAVTDTALIAQLDPGDFAGRALAQALERQGIEVAGPVLVRYTPAAEPATRDGLLRTAWRSAPLISLVGVSLERSDNWLTEQVLKTIGAERGDAGSWSAGTRVAERYLIDSVGVAPGAVHLADGSGLATHNLATPGAVVLLLDHVRDQPWGVEFRAAMAEPGEEHSTLEDRLAGLAGRLWAKTGTLRHVTALSGYLRTEDDRDLIFSIMTNASGQTGTTMREAVDRIVEAMTRTRN